MPPRARGRAGASSSAIPAPPVDPVPTSTVHVLPSHPTGYCLQASLFFRSDLWIAPLRDDVEALLDGFERRWSAQAGQGDHGGAGEGAASASTSASTSASPTTLDTPAPGPADAELVGPFEVFKRLWIEQGWTKIHLLGIMDGPARVHWGESVLRGFLADATGGSTVEHLVPTQLPLKQVAALFAIYTFCKTQPEGMQKTFVKLDPPTLEYLLTLPDVLSPSLDSPFLASTSSPSLPPSADLLHILSTLLFPASPAIHLVPTPLYLHPSPLPCVSVQDVSKRDLAGTAQLLLGAEEELELWQHGRVSELKRLRRDDEEEDEDEDETAGGTEGEDGWSDARGWTGQLSPLRRAYTSTKASSASLLARPRTTLQQQVMDLAQGMTLRAVSELGGAGGVLAEGGGKRGLLGLVEGGRGKRRREGDREGTDPGEYERVLRELRAGE
ncbi:hypothetical protein JCM21900_005409 [Sporobolomyces salmonicolor]